MKSIKTTVSLTFVGILILTLVLTACAPSNGGAGGEIILRPNTVVADEETENVLTSATEDHDVLTFSASTTKLDALEPGDVIVIGSTNQTPYGLLRKVTAITSNGEGVVVETEFATMEDALEEGTITVTAEVTAADVEATTLGLEGITMLAQSEGTGFTIQLDKTIGDFTFTGQLEFRANPIIRVEGTWWRARLDELEFSIETNESINVQVEVDADIIDYSERIPLLPHPISKTVAFQAGPIPVVAVIYFTPVIIVEADLSGHLYAGVGYEGQRKAGLHYLRDRDPSWTSIREEQTSFDGGAELYIQANLQASIGPEVAVKFYKVVGPTGNMYGYLQFESTMDPLLWWGLYGGLRAELGIKAEFPIFGWEIGYGPKQVMHYRWLLAEHQSDEEPVYFADPNLEATVREAIGKPTGDIYPSDLAGLTSLDASERNITDITGLEYCTDLIMLNLGRNEISVLSPLADLTALTHLSLHSNQISNISPLANLANLTHLYLGGSQMISDISPLANLTNLVYLCLHSDQISDTSPLANLTNLTHLYLGGDQISDISPLANLTNLTTLDLEDCQIINVSALSNLTNLMELNVSENQVVDISPLSNLTNLTKLNLSENQIASISALSTLTSLTELDLRVNEINNISPLSDLTSLTLIWLAGNQIVDISPLVENEGLGEGDEVSLWSNPLSDDSINIYIPELEARGVIVDY